MFKIKWLNGSDKPGKYAKCKGAYSDDMLDMRVRYKTNTGERGVWELSKTSGKVRTQQKGTSTMKYDDFVEGIMRVAMYNYQDDEPWNGLEQLILKHVIPKALQRWNVDPND